MEAVTSLGRGRVECSSGGWETQEREGEGGAEALITLGDGRLGLLEMAPAGDV